ncbi:putative eka-like protein [Erysiphe necator]|uniref:Putative eka-like protein n=1 Tax=Uncinula necator TaxID=52586 RepID=A0A0B1P2W8_UNCNE|nr:putative eka-like protein [Erysiphe necator]
MHTENDCKALTKCKNCGGPHRSDSHKCLARPTRSGGPTKEQLKTFRTVGEREYQAVARAKAAEQKALASEDNILIWVGWCSGMSSGPVFQVESG